MPRYVFTLCKASRKKQSSEPCISGAHLAEMSIFLNVSNILAVFDISKPVDEHGVEVEPMPGWTTGATMLVHDTYY